MLTKRLLPPPLPACRSLGAGRSFGGTPGSQNPLQYSFFFFGGGYFFGYGKGFFLPGVLPLYCEGRRFQLGASCHFLDFSGSPAAKGRHPCAFAPAGYFRWGEKRVRAASQGRTE